MTRQAVRILLDAPSLAMNGNIAKINTSVIEKNVAMRDATIEKSFQTISHKSEKT